MTNISHFLNRVRLLAVLSVCLIICGRASAAITNIACVGDSITFGAGLSTTAETYPFKLQQLLGANYNVQNFGVSGTTLLKAGDSPYWNTIAYSLSHGLGRGGTPPNIVVIMLGSNDAKPQNWAFGANFIQDYTDLVASYVNLSSHPRIILCTPPPVYGAGAFNINPGVVETNVAPLVQQLSLTLGRQLIDMNSLLAGHSEWFPDTVHPNDAGTTQIASFVNAAIVPEPTVAAVIGVGLLIVIRNAQSRQRNQVS